MTTEHFGAIQVLKGNMKKERHNAKEEKLESERLQRAKWDAEELEERKQRAEATGIFE
jgi:hypothetical protein